MARYSLYTAKEGSPEQAFIQLHGLFTTQLSKSTRLRWALLIGVGYIDTLNNYNFVIKEYRDLQNLTVWMVFLEFPLHFYTLEISADTNTN